MIATKIPSPMPEYYIVRIPKEEQRNRLEKIGVLFYPPEYAYMKRGMQCGEIIGIGADAQSRLPEARPGHILLFHHFIEGKASDKGKRFFIIEEDEDYNYYAVTGMDHNGDKNLAYGVWTGEELIPNKDYIFLFPESKQQSDFEDFSFNFGGADMVTNVAMTQAKAGLVVPKSTRVPREELTRRMKDNMARIKAISPYLQMREDVGPEIQRLEQENLKMAKEVNKRRYEPYEVASISESYQRYLYDSFNCLVGGNDIIYLLNIAAHMLIEFMGNEYIIAETKYIYSPLEWITKSVSNFNETRPA